MRAASPIAKPLARYHRSANCLAARFPTGNFWVRPTARDSLILGHREHVREDAGMRRNAPHLAQFAIFSW